MTSAIDPTKPLDGVPALKADLRANFAVAKSEIEALQVAQVPAGGAPGQVLKKTAPADHAMAWADISASANALTQGFAAPEDYGAAGNGTTDDTTAWADLVSALEAGTIKGIWCKPGAIYQVNRRTIVISGANDWIIHGNGAKIRANDAPASPSTDPHYYTDFVMWLDQCHGWRIHDLFLDGARGIFSPANEFDANIYIDACNNWWIDGLNSINACGDGIELGTPPARSGTQSGGVYTYHPRNWRISNCRVYNAYRNALTVDYGHDGTIIGCIFENTNGTNPRQGIDFEPISAQGTGGVGVSNISIIGCTFKDNEGPGIGSVGTKDRWRVRGISIVGCVFDNNSTIGWGNASIGSQARDGGRGALTMKTDDWVVTGCVFRNHTTPPDNDVSKHLIWLEGGPSSYALAKRWVISGNTFTNNTGMTALIASLREIGAYGEVSHPGLITGNYFDMTDGLHDAAVSSSVEEKNMCGVSLAYDGITVMGNVFAGNGAVAGVRLAGGADDIDIRGNRFDGCATAIRVGSGCSAIVRDNVMRNVTTPYDVSGTLDSGYPTSNPGVSGVVWNDGGTLKVVP